jgi:hypothetical protein
MVYNLKIFNFTIINFKINNLIIVVEMEMIF